MRAMSVTLDVSKLSGWLNADAAKNMCLMVVTLEVSRLSGWLNPDASLNISYMFVTLEVSKLSGWLNACVPCRVERRACDVGSGTALEREGAGWRRRKRHARGGPDSRLWGPGHARSAL